MATDTGTSTQNKAPAARQGTTAVVPHGGMALSNQDVAGKARKRRRSGGGQLVSKALNSSALGHFGSTIIGGAIAFGTNAMIDSPKTLLITEGVLTGVEVLGSIGAHIWGSASLSSFFAGLANNTIGSMTAKAGRKVNWEGVQKDPERLKKAQERLAASKSHQAEVRGNFNPAAGEYDERGVMSGASNGPTADKTAARAAQLRRRRTMLARRAYWNARRKNLPHDQAYAFARRFAPLAASGYELEESSAGALTEGLDSETGSITTNLLASLFERAFSKPQAPINPNVQPPLAQQVSGEVTEADLDLAEMAGLGFWVQTGQDTVFVPVEGDDGNELSIGEVYAIVQGLFQGETGAFERTKAWFKTRKRRKALRKAGSRKKQRAYERRMMAKERRKQRERVRPAEAEWRAEERAARESEADYNEFDDWEAEEPEYEDEGSYDEYEEDY